MSSNAATALDDALGIAPGPGTRTSSIIAEAKGKDLDKDFDIARKSLQRLVEIGTESAEELARLANSADNPQSYVALAGLIKSTTDTAEKLVILTKRWKESQQAVSPTAEEAPRLEKAQSTFIGTMAEALTDFERARASK